LTTKICDKEVFEKGTFIWMGHPEIPLEEMEKWVKKLAKMSG